MPGEERDAVTRQAEALYEEISESGELVVATDGPDPEPKERVISVPPDWGCPALGTPP
ncbi:MAG: hypothetical protein QOD57_3363 [Actinomycetota bacterium]|nr:hypothetical protein [Actinomycetota bacterium]